MLPRRAHLNKIECLHIAARTGSGCAGAVLSSGGAESLGTGNFPRARVWMVNLELSSCRGFLSSQNICPK